MNFKSFTALALTAATLATTVGDAAKAQAKYAVNYQHQSLINSVKATGINFQVNPPQCFEDDAPMGYYWAAKNEMVICQELARSNNETMWTAEDLDTLRHEAHHLVQDCMSGQNRDGHLGAVYQNPLKLAKDWLSNDLIGWIINEGYKNETDHIKVMELEAFTVALMNDPVEQVEDINKFCF